MFKKILFPILITIFVSSNIAMATPAAKCPSNVLKDLENYVSQVNQGKYYDAAQDLDIARGSLNNCLVEGSVLSFDEVIAGTYMLQDYGETSTVVSTSSALSKGLFSFEIRLCKSLPGPFKSKIRICISR